MLLVLAQACAHSAVLQHGAIGPAYPLVLRDALIEGAVTLRFTVDASGALDTSSVETLDADHSLLDAAARNAVAGWRWSAARDWLGRRRTSRLTRTFHWHIVQVSSEGEARVSLCEPTVDDASTGCSVVVRPSPARAPTITMIEVVPTTPRSGMSRVERERVLDELARRRRRWLSMRPVNYRYRERVTCGMCTIIGRGRRPDGSRVVTVRKGHAGIDTRFDEIARAARDTLNEIVDVSYDPRYGYPSRVHIAPDATVSDGDHTIMIDHFVALAARAKRPGPATR